MHTCFPTPSFPHPACTLHLSCSENTLCCRVYVGNNVGRHTDFIMPPPNRLEEICFCPVRLSVCPSIHDVFSPVILLNRWIKLKLYIFSIWKWKLSCFFKAVWFKMATQCTPFIQNLSWSLTLYRIDLNFLCFDSPKILNSSSFKTKVKALSLLHENKKCMKKKPKIQSSFY